MEPQHSEVTNNKPNNPGKRWAWRGCFGCLGLVFFLVLFTVPIYHVQYYYHYRGQLPEDASAISVNVQGLISDYNVVVRAKMSKEDFDQYLATLKLPKFDQKQMDEFKARPNLLTEEDLAAIVKDAEVMGYIMSDRDSHLAAYSKGSSFYIYIKCW